MFCALKHTWKTLQTGEYEHHHRTQSTLIHKKTLEQLISSCWKPNTFQIVKQNRHFKNLTNMNKSGKKINEKERNSFWNWQKNLLWTFNLIRILFMDTTDNLEKQQVSFQPGDISTDFTTFMIRKGIVA